MRLLYAVVVCKEDAEVRGSVLTPGTTSGSEKCFHVVVVHRQRFPSSCRMSYIVSGFLFHFPVREVK